MMNQSLFCPYIVKEYLHEKLISVQSETGL